MAIHKIRLIATDSLASDGAATCYPVQASNGSYYVIYTQGNASPTDPTSLNFIKSSDRLSWSTPAVVSAILGRGVFTWYDRWSGIAADLIHTGYLNGSNADIQYRNINTASADAISGAVTVFAGASVAAGRSLSIVRGRGTNIVVAGTIDAGAEDGAWESADGGATWGSAIADPSEAATDQYLLLPGWNADTEDQMLLFWDFSANELSVKRYDNSANTWAEASISASMVEVAASTVYPNFAATVDLINSKNYVIAWTGYDTALADLKCWSITDTTITALTNVVTDGTDDQGLCALGLATDTGYLHAFYCGKSDGSETANTAWNIYTSVSTDLGVTWGAETLYTTAAARITMLHCVPQFTGLPFVVWMEVAASTENYLYTLVDITSARPEFRGPNL